MKYPAHLLPCVLAAALALAHTSCTTLLQADFDADTVGALPDTKLPGDPAGDSIYSTVTGTLRVVVDLELGSRSLRFGNEGGEVKYLGFVPVAASPRADLIFAHWKGVAGTAHAPLDLWLADIRLSRIGGIRLDRGMVRVRTGVDRFETLGTYQRGVLHTVLFTLDRKAGTFSVHFYQGATTLSRTGLPIETVTGGAITPMLVLSYGPGGDPAARYVCDDIVISQRNPPRSLRKKPLRP